LKSEVDIGAHFAKHSVRYHQSVQNANKVLYQNIAAELNQNLDGTVLDIGSGNVFDYDITKLSQVIAVDLAFTADMQNTDKIKYIQGDARHLKDIDDNCCDNVIMRFLLHHIVEKSKTLTDNSVLTSLKESNRVLKPNGKLIIIEMLVRPFIEQAENILYGINYKLLTLIRRPMVRFYSEQKLHTMLKAAGFPKITTKQIHMGKYIDPFGALFPGVIKLPVFLYPARCCSIIAIK
jgi:ubiquinone/menaquinone biosynthesis C-methylase UbiE